MKLTSILTTFVLGTATLFSVSPTNAALTEGLTAYDAMTIYLRRDMNAVAHATLETKNPEMIGVLESFLTTVESSLQATNMDFDTYRAMRKAVYDKYTTIVSSSRVNDLVNRVDALTDNDADLNDLSLALYAPAAASDYFFDVAGAIANSIDAKEFQQLVKDERKYVERKVNEKANPAWVAAYLHGVLDNIRDLNETYARQIENTQGSVFTEMEKKFGDSDLSSSTKTLL